MAMNWLAGGDETGVRGEGPADRMAARGHGKRPLCLTAHARARAARRNVAPDAVDYVLMYGRRIQRTGVAFYFLGRRDMPPADRCASWAARLEGTIVVVAADGAVITLYRNRRGVRAIQRKLKYRISELARCGVGPGVGENAALWASA